MDLLALRRDGARSQDGRLSLVGATSSRPWGFHPHRTTWRNTSHWSRLESRSHRAFVRVAGDTKSPRGAGCHLRGAARPAGPSIEPWARSSCSARPSTNYAPKTRAETNPFPLWQRLAVRAADVSEAVAASSLHWTTAAIRPVRPVSIRECLATGRSTGASTPAETRTPRDNHFRGRARAARAFTAALRAASIVARRQSMTSTPEARLEDIANKRAQRARSLSVRRERRLGSGSARPPRRPMAVKSVSSLLVRAGAHAAEQFRTLDAEGEPRHRSRGRGGALRPPDASKPAKTELDRRRRSSASPGTSKSLARRSGLGHPTDRPRGHRRDLSCSRGGRWALPPPFGASCCHFSATGSGLSGDE